MSEAEIKEVSDLTREEVENWLRLAEAEPEPHWDLIADLCRALLEAWDKRDEWQRSAEAVAEALTICSGERHAAESDCDRWREEAMAARAILRPSGNPWTVHDALLRNGEVYSAARAANEKAEKT